MKLSTYIVFVVAICAGALAGHVLADVQSLRGNAAIPSTLDAPKLMKYIKDKENIPRTFKQQPPLVPHLNDKYTVNLQVNKCLDCHMKQPGKKEAKSVEMSESHFVDRNGNKLDKPTSARHFCKQCHVPQVDAEPLVGMTFRAAE